MKKNESTLARNLKESRELQETLKNLEKTFPFINDEKDFFGKILKFFIFFKKKKKRSFQQRIRL